MTDDPIDPMRLGDYSEHAREDEDRKDEPSQPARQARQSAPCSATPSTARPTRSTPPTRSTTSRRPREPRSARLRAPDRGGMKKSAASHPPGTTEGGGFSHSQRFGPATTPMRRTRKWAYVAQEARRLADLGLSAAEIGRRLEVNRSTVHRWMATGKLPDTKGSRLVGPAVEAASPGRRLGVRRPGRRRCARRMRSMPPTSSSWTLATAALTVAKAAGEPATVRLQAAGRFQALVKQLALVARKPEAETAPAPSRRRPPVRAPRADPRAIAAAPMILTVPHDRALYPTLGPQVCDFIEQNLVFGPGDLRGQPARLDDEKAALIYRMYEVYPQGHRAGRAAAVQARRGLAPQGHGEDGARGVDRGLRAPSGRAGAVHRLDAERRADRRAGHRSLHPAGGVHRGAVRRAGLYGALRVILEQSALRDDFDIGLERILRKRGDGKAVALAAAPDARDGARTTFQHFDETHRFTLPRLMRAHQTMLANIPKRRGADAWTLETTTAPEPGTGSVAEAHDGLCARGRGRADRGCAAVLLPPRGRRRRTT